MIKVYAFDFDGVLAENHNELPYFSRIAWEKTTNRKCRVSDSDVIKSRPFTRDAREIYALISILEKGLTVTKTEIQKIVSSDKENAEKFAHHFYEARHKMQDENKSKWLEFYTKITPAIDLFNKLAKNNKVYIVSSKDKKTITNLVEHFGIKISENFILSKEISFDKLHHMDIIRKTEHVEYSDIVFIDDAIDHLKPLVKTGINVILASWGYATDDDVKEAKELGIKVATKENFEKMVRAI